MIGGRSFWLYGRVRSLRYRIHPLITVGDWGVVIARLDHGASDEVRT